MRRPLLALALCVGCARSEPAAPEEPDMIACRMVPDTLPLPGGLPGEREIVYRCLPPLP